MMWRSPGIEMHLSKKRSLGKSRGLSAPPPAAGPATSASKPKSCPCGGKLKNNTKVLLIEQKCPCAESLPAMCPRWGHHRKLNPHVGGSLIQGAGNVLVAQTSPLQNVAHALHLEAIAALGKFTFALMRVSPESWKVLPTKHVK